MAAAAKSRNGRPSYEELQPRFEWKDDDASPSHVLNIFLPGFVKEQLKLTHNEPTRSLNVRGERANGTNRFVRFNKGFRIPDNARLKEMKAKFESETLIVTIPKQILTSPPPLPPLPPQATKPQERGSPGKLPPMGEKGANQSDKETKRRENDGSGTLIPPSQLAPLPTPAPRTKAPKADDGTKDRTREREGSVKSPLSGEDSGAAMIPMKEMKVGLKEERKLMGNVVMAAIVLVALGAYICYYTLGLGISRN